MVWSSVVVWVWFWNTCNVYGNMSSITFNWLNKGKSIKSSNIYTKTVFCYCCCCCECRVLNGRFTSIVALVVIHLNFKHERKVIRKKCGHYTWYPTIKLATRNFSNEDAQKNTKHFSLIISLRHWLRADRDSGWVASERTLHITSWSGWQRLCQQLS